jgi:cytoskeletal protein CcmA (bactofilin family)
MWKKDDEIEPDQVRSAQKPPIPERHAGVREATGRATIGPSITIRGDISGDEDLVVLGNVEGTIDLKDQNVTIGQGGRVKADVVGNTVTVEGEVDGNLRGEEQVILRGSSRVEGNVAAPRVTLEDGAVFKGSIDMGTKAQSAPQEKKLGGAPGDRKLPPADRPDDTPAAGTGVPPKATAEAEAGKK